MGHMFSQIQGTLSTGLAEHLQASAASNKALAQGLQEATAQVEAAAAALRSSKQPPVDSRGVEGSAGGQMPEGPVHSWLEIQQHLALGDYENAFTKALCMNDIGQVSPPPAFTP